MQQGYIIIPETQFQSWNRLDCCCCWIQPLFLYIYIYLLAFPIYIPAADRFHMLYTAAASAALYSVSSSLYICCCCLLSPDPPPSSCPAFPYIIKVSAAASIIIVRHSAAERRHSRPYKVSTSSVCRLISITQRRPIHIYFRYRCCCCSTTVCIGTTRSTRCAISSAPAPFSPFAQHAAGAHALSDESNISTYCLIPFV